MLSSPPALWCVSWGRCDGGVLRKLVHCQLPLSVCPQSQVSLPSEQGGVLRATHQPRRGEGTALDGHCASFFFSSSFLPLLLCPLRNSWEIVTFISCNSTVCLPIQKHSQYTHILHPLFSLLMRWPFYLLMLNNCNSEIWLLRVGTLTTFPSPHPLFSLIVLLLLLPSHFPPLFSLLSPLLRTLLSPLSTPPSPPPAPPPAPLLSLPLPLSSPPRLSWLMLILLCCGVW